MGWMFSIAMFIVGCIKGSEALLVSAGLFAVAGAIGFAAIDIRQAIEQIGFVEVEDKVRE